MPAPDWIFPADFDVATLSLYAGFVYLITHVETGRAYVGRKYLKAKRGRTTVESDWRRYWSSSKELKAEFKANGHDGWTREIISFHRTKGEVNYAEVAEQFRRDVLHARLADGSPRYLNRNIMGRWFAAKDEHSEATKAKMSAQRKGRPKPPFSDEHRAKISANQLGRNHTSQTRAKMSATRSGVKPSADLIAKRASAKSKLSAAEVRSIMDDPRATKELAALYALSESQVRRIRNGTACRWAFQ